jgi:hypothetical protein
METFIIERLELMQDDLPDTMSWDDAKAYADELGDGWRMPTNEEFATILKLFRLNIGGFKPERYWANSSSGLVGWFHNMNVGYSPHLLNKFNTLRVRLVRTT